MAIPTFVDEVSLRVTGGRGGNGVASVHREKFKPLGGPDGGNGGDGGDVVLRVDANLTTLVDYRHETHRKAGDGRHGRGGNRSGAAGETVILAVPDGTVVSARDGTPIADLTGDGTELVIAGGGKGGLGNAALASRARKAPGFALIGEPGEDRTVVLELKVVADVGLVGFPSAGKSSLIAAISRSRPKIADYPFTTLVPNLGVVTAGDITYTVADVPGLIAGASHGRGRGLGFLRHIERCSAIVHVVDCATSEPGRDPASDLQVIEDELATYGGLADRPRVIALNKMDVPEARELADLVASNLSERGWPVYRVSAATHGGLRDLTYALGRLVADQRSRRPAGAPTRIVLRPDRVEGSDFLIERVGAQWNVRGTKPERWVRQTDFANDEAVGFLADRLARLGVEQRLLDLGAQAGDDVVIGEPDDGVVFELDPRIEAGAATLLGRRGADRRLEGR